MTLSLTLAGCSLAGLDEWDLIRDLRDERGIISGEWTAGQVELAKWMLGRDLGEDYGVRFSRLAACLTEAQAVRILTGEAEPETGIANMIAETTGGAVRPGMFARAVVPPVKDLPVAPVSSAAPAKAPRHVQLDDHFDLLNGSDGVTIVGHGQSIKIPFGAAAMLRGGLGQMLAI
ncbi:hypothetical protein [Sphingomonas oryzagri]|uniref:DUF937 domain-containing protein n=1 Tax=Sphingomonas oryzagri TaxID=3042314 RepID=A0ABT6N606_9SPHN|nr:hypothetical protein [Sphingomonas oryzagri]MDH7640543.1 hypothetical protein [Sphingomonas oryzagri]